MVKKTSVQKIVAMLCSALLNLTVVIPTAAEMVSLHVSFLENLGIDTMSVCLPSDTISIQQGRNMIFQLTGETVNVNSVQRPDVVEAFIRAMQYGYLLTDTKMKTAAFMKIITVRRGNLIDICSRTATWSRMRSTILCLWAEE